MEKGTVVITDARTREARDAGAFLAESGWDVRFLPENTRLWDEEEVSAFARAHRETLAGVIHPAPPLYLSPLAEVTEEQILQAGREGPLAAWCVAKVFGGLFREKGRGTIIFLNSIHAEKPMGRGALFSMECGAVQMLQREINQDYGPAGVRSFFIQRGITETDPDVRNDLSSLYFGVPSRYPERKMPQPGQLNELLAFLLSPGAAALSGSDLRADGGLTMYYGERISEERAKKLREERARGQAREVTIIGEDP